MQRLRRKASRYNRIDDSRVAQRLEQVIEHLKPRSILFYLPMPIEVDLTPLMKRYRPKCKIFVPFIVEESFKMIKYRLPLKRNRYAILEPRNSQFRMKSIDLMIAPVVGVDGACKRVGFGKGMYDRFFQRLQKKPVVVFVQRVKCHTHDIVTDSYDIAADYYITPKETLFQGIQNDNRNRHRRGRYRGRCRHWRPDRQ